ncbi:MAG: HNH endonuclease [Ekhidna sp.]|nr:HNH endonuclease [Ekhidna sp.]
MKKVKSELPISYITIKTTKSRINKGLLAIPMSLIDLFPKNTNKIFLVNDNGQIERKTFTPYNSSSRECRIGGLREFYKNHSIVDGEELVIQLLDNDKFRILPEKLFQHLLKTKRADFEQSISEDEAERNLTDISRFVNLTQAQILKNEFIFRSKQEINERKFIEKNKTKVRENVPCSIRKILLELYSGRCQVTDFTFLTESYEPYFDVHHIEPKKGNHFKNLLVVSPNTHARFTHCILEQNFDKEGWLRKVKFNDEEFKIFQIIDKLNIDFKKEVHF